MSPALGLARAGRRALGRARRLLLSPALGVPRPRGAPDPSMAVPFRYDLSATPAPDRPIGVVCHLFHEELAPEMRALMGHVPFPADIHLSTDTEAKRAAIARAFADWPNGTVNVRVAPNRGRDIAPKLVTFRDAYDRHDLLLFLHGKRSLTSTIGDRWRETLTDTLLGSPDVVRSVVDLFRREPGVGVVAPQHFEPIRDLLHWDGNLAVARGLAARMGFRLSWRHRLDLPSGSMFWARTAALRPLLDIGLTAEDFPPELNQTRGTPQHAIERLVFFVCERAGFSWVKIAAPHRYRDRSEVRAIVSPAALRRFVAEERVALLPSGARRG